jgi:hypothetical protein
MAAEEQFARLETALDGDVAAAKATWHIKEARA